jgi:hypothetical protein
MAKPMNIKYQIFISSTYEDLKHEREQVIKAVLEMGHIPVGMEMFSAADAEQWAIIQRQIDDCDYYAVVMAHRYGSMDGGVSFTEKEYDYATSKGVPSIAFILDDSAPWPANKRDNERPKQEALERFKTKLKRKLVSFWSSADDLYGKFSISFMKLMNAHPRPGWARATEIAGPEVMKELTRLSSENASLRKDLDSAQTKARTDAQAERDKLLTALKKNKSNISFYYNNSKDWENEKEYTLFRLFRLIAPELMIEQSTTEIANHIGFMLNPDLKRTIRETWPIPSNNTREFIADFVSLGLIEPSKRKHSLKNTEEYWTLSHVGRELYAHIRRLVLEGEEPVSTTPMPAIPGPKPAVVPDVKSGAK